MSLVTDHDSTASGYEAVLLSPAPGGEAGPDGASAPVPGRRGTRLTRRAVIYVHCTGDSFVPADLAAWYVDRGFHFYVADLSSVGQDGEPGARAGQNVAGELSGRFACLDAAVAHLRDTEGIGTVVAGAHGAGAVIAALWSHARRGSQPADALVLASPGFTAGSRRTAGGEGQRRPWPLLAGAQRRLRHGLDIVACPVLVMCPAAGCDAPGGPGGLLGWRLLAGGRATTRLGAHVTWMELEGGQPGEALPGPAGRKRFFDELGRWLGACLSGQIRDQLL